MSQNLDYQFIDKLTQLAFIEEIWLFGSRARGDHGKKSDIDLAVICPTASENEWMKVVDIIEDADTLLKIDCIRFDENKLSKELYDSISKYKKVIYAKK